MLFGGRFLLLSVDIFIQRIALPNFASVKKDTDYER